MARGWKLAPCTVFAGALFFSERCCGGAAGEVGPPATARVEVTRSRPRKALVRIVRSSKILFGLVGLGKTPVICMQ